MDQNFAYTGTLENSANNFVGAVYYASNDNVVEVVPIPKVGGVYPLPPLSMELTFNDLTEGIGYIFRMWESPDNTANGKVRTSYSFIGRNSRVAVREDLQLRVGTTPGLNDGDTAYTDASLIGWNFRISKEGSGPFFFSDFWARPTEDVVQLATGLLFAGGEGYNLEFYPQIQFYDSIQSGMPTASRTITVDDALTYADANKYINTQGIHTNIAISLPAISTMVEFQPIYLRSNGGSHINARYYCLGSDRFEDGSVEIVLARDEYIMVYVEGGVWKLFGDTFGIDNVGQIIYSYSNSEKKAIYANGTEKSRKDFYRLYKKALADGKVITKTQWQQVDGNGDYPYKGFYHNGDGVNTFGIPILALYPYLSAVDVSVRSSGSFQKDGVGSFNAKITGRKTQRSGADNKVLVLDALDGVDFGALQSASLPVLGDSADGKTHPGNIAVYASIRF